MKEPPVQIFVRSIKIYSCGDFGLDTQIYSRCFHCVSEMNNRETRKPRPILEFSHSAKILALQRVRRWLAHCVLEPW